MNKEQIKETIARRAAKEFRSGDFVNLGFGIPTLIPIYLPENVDIIIQSENGIVGVGSSPKTPTEGVHYLVNASGEPTTLIHGGCITDSACAFTMICGGHVDITVLGALEVDEKGNLANWIVPGKQMPGMGGAMDLVVGAKKVIVVMEHTAKGDHKILKQCTLPLTAVSCVDIIITEMGVMEVTPQGLLLTEYNSAYTVEEIQAATDAELIISDTLSIME